MFIITHFLFVFTATDAWMMIIRPHRMQTHTVRLAASGDPDYLMPADVFKKPSWEPSIAQPIIQQSQPLPSSLSPAPAESISAASSLTEEEEDMILISAATSVSRPPAPTTHPSALRPPANSQASVVNTRSSVPATPVDDRNILFWRDRMTAQEQERNQKGFRPAFLTEDTTKEAFHASINEHVAQTMPEQSTKSVSKEQVTPHEVSSDDRVTSDVSSQPDPLLAPATPSLGVATKQPVVGEIPVLFWRDRMNEQEEARNRQGFRNPFTDNREEIIVKETFEESLSVNGVNGAAQEEFSSIAEESSVELITSSSGVLTESNENTHIDGAAFTEDDLSELNSEPAQTGKVDSISESVSMETDNKAATLEDSKEATELNLEPATAIDEAEEIAALQTGEVDSVFESHSMESVNKAATSNDSTEDTELNLVPVASSTISETEGLQEMVALEAVEEGSVSVGALVESGDVVAVLEAGQVAAPDADQGDESTVAVTEYSFAEASLMDIDSKVDVPDDVEVSSDPLPSAPIAETENEEEIEAEVAEEFISMETEREVVASEDLPETSSAPLAISSVLETEQTDEIASPADPISKPALTESNSINVSPISAASYYVDEPSGLDEIDAIFAPTTLDVNQEMADVESQIESSSGLTQVPSVPESDPVYEIVVSSPPVSDAPIIGEMNTVAEDAAAAAPVEPISAKSSTKDLLQYLFTGSTEGSDDMTDETVNQYLADPNSVIAKLNGGETAILNGKVESANGHMLIPSNGKSNVPKPSTNELLDILFGVTEETSTEDDESRRKDTSELLNGDLSLNETAVAEEEPEKEKLTSSKVREMALFTLKELLLQDRQ